MLCYFIIHLHYIHLFDNNTVVSIYSKTYDQLTKYDVLLRTSVLLVTVSNILYNVQHLVVIEYGRKKAVNTILTFYHF